MKENDVMAMNGLIKQCVAPPGSPGRSALSPPGTGPPRRTRVITVLEACRDGP